MTDTTHSANVIILTTRQYAILSQLLRSDGVVTAAQLASSLGITPRVVRYDLTAIRTWLGARGIRLVKKPGYGILVGASGEVRMDLHRELTCSTRHRLVLSPTERLHISILRLLTDDEPVLAKQLRCRLAVSYPTVLGDMRKAERWLERHGLQLVSRPNFGSVVVGTEKGKREALIGFLLENMDEELRAQCMEPNPALRADTKNKTGLRYALSVFLESLELDFARTLVEVVEGLLPLPFADTARVTLVLCLAILVRRVQEGHTVEPSPDQPESLRQREEFRVATIAADEIAQRFGIVLPEPEIVYIAMQVLGAGIRRPLSDTIAEGDMDGIDPQVSELVRDLVAQSSIYLQPCLSVDQQLIRNLGFHLTAVLNRLRFGLPIRNPLLADIKSEYPYIFQVAQRASIALESEVGETIPEEEVGYIAMHLGAAMERFRSSFTARKRVLVVCGEGVATAWLLVSRIQVELPEIDVVGITPVTAVPNDFARSCDIAAIISTVPLATASVPVVVVSPLLPREDVSQVRAILKVATASPASAHTSKGMAGATLADLVCSETLALRVAADNWMEVVNAAGALLLSTGAIEAQYVEAMKQLIERHGPYVVIMPEVALLHAHPGKGVKRMSMSMVTLREPVPFGHLRNDPVSVAVAMATIDNHGHWKALRQLVDMLTDREMLCSIKNATTKDKVLNLIAAVSRASQ